MAQSVAIFFDFQNVHLVGRDSFNRNGRLLECVPDPVRLAESMASRRNRKTELRSIRVYRGRPNPEYQPYLATLNDAQADKWSRDERVQVTQRQLNYCDWPQRRPQEKGIDVAIAVDLMRSAFQKEYDVLILFSSDTDLLPAVEAVADMRRCRIEVASWRPANRLRLSGTVLPYCHFLGREDWETCTEDWKGRV
jgi:uncharacterized LabA/DUF88 family protein